MPSASPIVFSLSFCGLHPFGSFAFHLHLKAHIHRRLRFARRLPRLGFFEYAVVRRLHYLPRKWFWLGFFFSFIALIVAATKPQHQSTTAEKLSTTSEKLSFAPVYAPSESEKKERERRLLSQGGWKCICGELNPYYVSSCVCGRNRNEGEINNGKKPQTPKEETSAQSEIDMIRKYKELLDSGIITQEEFDAKKKQLLGL